MNTLKSIIVVSLLILSATASAQNKKSNMSINYSQINDAHIWKFLNTSGGLESFQENKIKPESSMSLSYLFIKNLDITSAIYK